MKDPIKEVEIVGLNSNKPDSSQNHDETNAPMMEEAFDNMENMFETPEDKVKREKRERMIRLRKENRT